MCGIGMILKIKDYLRITIGTDEEMKIFLDFLKKKIGA